jgi:mannose-6-phosphate isomerase-like protein (cupin superfamily)
VKEHFQNVPFLVTSIENHADIKRQILNAISQMGVNRFTSSYENVSNTDWNLDSDVFRPYYPLVKLIMDNIAESVTKYFNYIEPLTVANYWFQQYEVGDYHNWHIHYRSLFSNVYYVDLPDGAAKTSFKLGNSEFEVDVKEGDILTFPSCFLHCSKPNKVGQKTVVSFNM